MMSAIDWVKAMLIQMQRCERIGWIPKSVQWDLIQVGKIMSDVEDPR